MALLCSCPVPVQICMSFCYFMVFLSCYVVLINFKCLLNDAFLSLQSSCFKSNLSFSPELFTHTHISVNASSSEWNLDQIEPCTLSLQKHSLADRDESKLFLARRNFDVPRLRPPWIYKMCSPNNHFKRGGFLDDTRSSTLKQRMAGEVVPGFSLGDQTIPNKTIDTAHSLHSTRATHEESPKKDAKHRLLKRKDAMQNTSPIFIVSGQGPASCPIRQGWFRCKRIAHMFVLRWGASCQGSPKTFPSYHPRKLTLAGEI